MFRSNPLWYKDGMSDVMRTFSSVLSEGRPKNLLLMPSFAAPDYEADGIHLTPYAGVEYLVHLFDSAKDLIKHQHLDDPVKIEAGSESTRLLEDRVMALEQGHKILGKDFETKFAADAELECFQENVRNECYFVISGLPKISDSLRGKEWQNKAVSDVQGVIRLLLGKDLPIIVVQNASGRGAEAPVHYHVKMESTAASQEVRGKFGMFFVGGTDHRPESLKEVSISNRVTPGTQVRLAIMKVMGKRYLGFSLS
jgi:hypothetical protein